MINSKINKERTFQFLLIIAVSIISDVEFLQPSELSKIMLVMRISVFPFAGLSCGVSAEAFAPTPRELSLLFVAG